MGNPQERSLVWLAAMIETEGSISCQSYILPDGRLRLTPFVAFVNSDMALVKEYVRICTELGAVTRVLKHTTPTNVPVVSVRSDGFKPVKTILTAVLPYIIGAKRKNADNILKFLESRAVRGVQRNEKGHCRRTEYTRAEIMMVAACRTHKKAKSSETLCQAPNVVG